MKKKQAQFDFESASLKSIEKVISMVTKLVRIEKKSKLNLTLKVRAKIKFCKFKLIDKPLECRHIYISAFSKYNTKHNTKLNDEQHVRQQLPNWCVGKTEVM